MLTGMKLLAGALIVIAAFYALVFAFFSSLFNGTGTVAGFIFLGGILVIAFGFAGLVGAAFGL